MSPEDVQDTSRFVASSQAVIGEQPMKLRSKNLLPQSTLVEEDLKKFLGKPFRVSIGLNKFATGDTLSTFPNQSLSSFPTVYKNKLDGIWGIKYDVRLKIVINATPFQQGRYIMYYVPTGGAARTGTPTDRTQAWIYSHSYNLTQITQLPHVQFDLANDTQAELHIPWNSQYQYLPVATILDSGFGTVYGSLGSWSLAPYSPLQTSGGSPTVGFSVWMSLENIEFFYAAYTGTIQSGIQKKEQDSHNAGPMESAAAKVSELAKVIAPVPFVGAYASTLGWVADIAARSFKVFGLSKPPNLDTMRPVEPSIWLNYNTTDGIRNSRPLALIQTNSVKTDPSYYSTSVDETAIDVLKRRFSYYITVSGLVTGVSPGTVLWDLTVSPSQFFLAYPAISSQVIQHTPISFLSQMFRKWRGGIYLRIKFVKTCFHSGRVRFSYQPDLAGTILGGNTLDLSMYNYNTTVDLRDQNEVLIYLPYMSERVYKETYIDGVNEDWYMGRFSIIVVDSLVAPDTVPGYVPIIVEVAGAPDLEFADPAPQRMKPVFHLTTQSGLTNNMLSSAPIGSIYTPPEISTDSAELCIGEQIRSLRAMSRRSTYLGYGAEGEKYATIVKTQCWEPLWWNGVDPINNDISQPSDFLTILMSMFVYSRGGINIKAYYNPNPDDRTGYPEQKFTATLTNDRIFTWDHHVVYNSNSPVDMGFMNMFSGPVAGFWAGSGLNQSFFYGDNFKVLDVDCPSYSTVPARCNAENAMYILTASSPPAQTYDQRYNSSKQQLVLQPTEQLNGGSFVVFRAGADDFDVGFFCSIPLMWIANM